MSLKLHVLASLEIICVPGAYLTFISDRICKNMPSRFSPRFGRSPNPGKAGDSKALSRLGRVHSPGNGLSAGGLLAASGEKQGGRGGCLVLTPPLS